MTRPATISEWMTIAVPTVVGDVLKLATIPPTETRRALMLKDIRIWAIATTIIGSPEVRSSGLWPVIETASVVNSVAPENWWAADWAPFVRSALTWGAKARLLVVRESGVDRAAVCFGAQNKAQQQTSFEAGEVAGGIRFADEQI